MENRFISRLCGAPNQGRTGDLFLTMEALCLLSYGSGVAPPVGFEPTTYRLTAERSTVELRRNKLKMTNVVQSHDDVIFLVQ